MGRVYKVGPDGTTEALEAVHCTDEARELQDLLERNPGLLPGKQIDPEDPRRWLLIKREMPVPDSATATERWSLDILFADQDAVPTFVECKRFRDTRARREVVGQLLEYAANGHYYWDEDEIRAYAEESAAAAGMSLEEALAAIGVEHDAISSFFGSFRENLREGQVRLVFFMEEAPMQLRSLVDFLNRQTERSEILLVEARLYTDGELRLITPMLFGYTEEARRAKRTVTVTTGGSRRKWDRESFLADAAEKLPARERDIVENLLRTCQGLGYRIDWGTGKNAGSYIVRTSPSTADTLVVVQSDGRLWMPFVNWAGDPQRESIRDDMRATAEKMGLELPSDWASRWVGFKGQEWLGAADLLAEALGILLDIEPGEGPLRCPTCGAQIGDDDLHAPVRATCQGCGAEVDIPPSPGLWLVEYDPFTDPVTGGHRGHVDSACPSDWDGMVRQVAERLGDLACGCGGTYAAEDHETLGGLDGRWYCQVPCVCQTCGDVRLLTFDVTRLWWGEPLVPDGL